MYHIGTGTAEWLVSWPDCVMELMRNLDMARTGRILWVQQTPPRQESLSDLSR